MAYIVQSMFVIWVILSKRKPKSSIQRNYYKQNCRHLFYRSISEVEINT
jgi:RNase P protein component